MKRTHVSVVRAIVVVAAATAVAVMGMPAAAAPAGESPADGIAPLEAAAAAYRTTYPQLSLDQARAAAQGQEQRKAVVAELVERHADSFGGAWFDAPSGVLHVAATTPSTVRRAVELARTNKVRLETHAVQRSFIELEQQANALRAGEGELGRAAQGRVGIDVTTNQVTVALSPELLTMRAPAGVTLIADPGIKTEPDVGCTSRDACDFTIRAGAMIWRGSVGSNVCSAGFTARNASNQRILYTAGHCSNGAGVTWGTGGEVIGPMGAAQDAGAVDGAAINITNSWFTGDIGGEIYFQGGSFSLPVKGVAPTLSFIVAGETVCLSANFTQPTGSNFCGTVGTNSDAAVRGMVRVDGFDACPGDSGGGWYWLPSSNNRYAYGMHSRSATGCHGAGNSWFSAVPTIKSAIAPTFDVELR
jgi:streptogrisin C